MAAFVAGNVERVYPPERPRRNPPNALAINRYSPELLETVVNFCPVSRCWATILALGSTLLGGILYAAGSLPCIHLPQAENPVRRTTMLEANRIHLRLEKPVYRAGHPGPATSEVAYLAIPN